MFEDLELLIDRLKRSGPVIGLVRYGSRGPADLSPGGDFDLFVFVEDRPADIESIHIYVGDIPVDLNIRCIQDLHRAQPLTAFDTALIQGEILYDKTGALAQELASLGHQWQRDADQLREHEIHMIRFCQQHVLDKVRGRTEAEPLLCEFLLSANIHWLVRAYFAVRGRQFPGEKQALEWLASDEPQVYANIGCFYASRDLAEKVRINERLTELILAPVGGPWRRDELMVLAAQPDASDLQKKGTDLFQALFQMTPGESQ